MEQKRLNELTHNVLINASQLAFIEEAAGTLMLLENYNELFRYLIRDVQLETLFKEVEILEKYIAVQKVRYGDRFSILVQNNPDYKSVFVRHLSVIDHFDSILYSAMEEQNSSVNLTVDFIQEEQEYRIQMTLEMDGQTKYFSQAL